MFVVIALAFAIVSGKNDGGTLLAIATRSGALTPAVGVLVLSAVIVLAPGLLGTSVATTFLQRLVSFEGSAGRLALLAATTSAIAVVWLLSSRGLPTSLTLALLGAMTGAGIGFGLSVSWSSLARILAIGLLAPPLSAAAGYLLAGGILRLPSAWGRAVIGHRWQRAALVLQCVAYSANDAQKMTAVIAIASATSVATGVPVNWSAQLAIGACFALGAAVGLHRLAKRVAEGLIRVRPLNSVTVAIASACVVLGSAAVGVPISSTQAATTALVGSSLETQRHRVRWEHALGVAGAWLLTLPVSAAAGIATGLVLKAIG